MTNDDRVLIVSTRVDPATDEVERLLAEDGVSYDRINTEDYPFGQTMTYSPTRSESLRSSGRDVPSAGTIWYRRVRAAAAPEAMDEGVLEFCRREARSFMLGTLLTREGRWMSHPARVWQAEFKPYQLHLAHHLGLTVPSTVITNDPEEIRAAYREFGRMIVKPVRTGHVVNRGIEHSIYTSELLGEHLDDLDDARLSPSIYQQLLVKKYDVRVTFVGDRHFAAAIDSQSDPAASVDWRQTENPTLPHYPIELPKPLVTQLRKMMRALGLQFGAIDLVRTIEDEYVFLEVNPNGQWLWLDDMLDLGISVAVSRWLSGSPS